MDAGISGKKKKKRTKQVSDKILQVRLLYGKLLTTGNVHMGDYARVQTIYEQCRTCPCTSVYANATCIKHDRLAGLTSLGKCCVGGQTACKAALSSSLRLELQWKPSHFRRNPFSGAFTTPHTLFTLMLARNEKEINFISTFNILRGGAEKTESM